MTDKSKIAVLFGGRSPEHDVSIVTGLQALDAIDPELFDAFPVYVSTQGEWYVGDALRDRGVYIPGSNELDRLTKVSLQIGSGARPALTPVQRSVFQRAMRLKIDVAFPAFHGFFGEDGRMQGAFEIAGVAYAGMRTMACAVLMDKVATKKILAGAGIPMLPYHEIQRPTQGVLVLAEELQAQLGDLSFPRCVKPVRLGSSIGVAKVDDWQELSDVLPEIFRLDQSAILEPFVPNLVEYNVSVARIDGVVRTSAIERPKRASELLDFRTKYLSGEGSKKSGAKQIGQTSEGMLSLTRDINPEIPAEMSKNIRDWASRAFEQVNGAGAPRVDFLSNSETGEVWLNEVNPCPGSLAYFLWEAAEPPMLFASLMEHLIAEAEAAHRNTRLPNDSTPEDARLFKRKS